MPIINMPVIYDENNIRMKWAPELKFRKSHAIYSFIYKIIAFLSAIFHLQRLLIRTYPV